MSDTPETMLDTAKNTIQAALDTAHDAVDAVVEAAQAMMSQHDETADHDHANETADEVHSEEHHAADGATDQPEV